MLSLRAILLAGTLLSLGACSGFLDGVKKTSDSLDRMAEDNGIVPQSETSLDAVYQDGVSEHQRGDDEAAAARFLQAAEAGHGPSA